MNEHTGTRADSGEPIRRRLIDLAERVGRAYMGIADVRAFVIFGSTADGVVDEDSDLDTVAYCESIPPLPAREDAMRRLGADPEACSSQTHWEGSPWDTVRLPDGGDCCILLKRTADVQAKAVSARDKIIRFCRRLDPLRERINGMPDPESDRLLAEAAAGGFWPSEEVLADLESCLVVADPEGVVRAWQAEIADFPAEARKVAIEHRLFFATMWVNEDMPRALCVGDETHFAVKRAWAVEHYLRLLYTLNRRYYRKPKWFARHVSGFQHAPADTVARLRRWWSGQGAAVVEGMLAFAGELIDCIREGCPEADVRRVAGWLGRG